MKRFIQAAIVLCIVAIPAASYADTVTLTLNSISNISQGGVSVGPYTLGVATPGAPNEHVFAGQIAAICDDFSHGTSTGQTWTATVSTFNDLSNTRFWNSNGLRFYEESAWLLAQIAGHPDQVGDIAFAIWGLDPPPNAQGHDGYTTNAAAWAALAAQDAPTDLSYYKNFVVFTPTDSSYASPQEFIAQTPEPGALALLGSGLVSGTILLRRKLFRKA